MDKPQKETLTVEFKSDRGPLKLDDLYEALVAMANTEGGVLCLGVEDNGTVTGVDRQHDDPINMAGKIQTHTVPALYPKIHIETWDGKDVLVIELESSQQLVMTSGGGYYRRRLKSDGTPEAIPMRPDEIVQRLSYIQQIDPSAQVMEGLSTEEAFNPLERERLRKMIRVYHGDASLLELTDEELDNALGFAIEKRGKVYPTMAGLLLIGKEKYIHEYIPGNEVLFQVMDGVNVLANPPAMRGPLLDIFERVDILFQSRITEREIQIGLFRVPIPNYEKDAFREGFVNAIVHRDYFRSGAVQVQLQSNAMVISSPGGFMEGISPDNILTAPPKPRNRFLAEAVKRIGLAERTGRGVDKIFESMLRGGHDVPDYSDSDSTSVVLRLNSEDVDEQFVQMLITEEQRMSEPLKVEPLIVLSTLKRQRRASLSELMIQLQRKRESDVRSIVEQLVEYGMIEGVGNGRARRYMLSAKIYELSGNKTGYTRQHGMTIIQEKSLIMQHIEQFNRITRAEVIDYCKCGKDHAYSLLRSLCDEGKLEMIGNGRGAFYQKKE